MTTSQRRSKSARATETRERLVAAATTVISEQGAAAATSRAITSEASENLAAITYYFGSKEALVAEALINHARSLIQPVLDELDADRTPTENLLAAVQLLTQIVIDRRSELSVYLEAIALSGHDDQVARALRELSRELRAHLAAGIRMQRTDGLIPSWVDPDHMATLIVSLATGVVAEFVIDPERTDPAAVGAQFASLLLAVRQPDHGRQNP